MKWCDINTEMAWVFMVMGITGSCMGLAVIPDLVPAPVPMAILRGCPISLPFSTAQRLGHPLIFSQWITGLGQWKFIYVTGYSDQLGAIKGTPEKEYERFSFRPPGTLFINQTSHGDAGLYRLQDTGALDVISHINLTLYDEATACVARKIIVTCEVKDAYSRCSESLLEVGQTVHISLLIPHVSCGRLQIRIWNDSYSGEKDELDIDLEEGLTHTLVTSSFTLTNEDEGNSVYYEVMNEKFSCSNDQANIMGGIHLHDLKIKGHPEILSIHPLVVLPIGGIHVNVTGNGLDHAYKPRMVITMVHKIPNVTQEESVFISQENCHVSETGSKMSCTTPVVTVPPEFRRQPSAATDASENYIIKRVKRQNGLGNNSYIERRGNSTLEFYAGVILGGYRKYMTVSSLHVVLDEGPAFLFGIQDWNNQTLNYTYGWSHIQINGYHLDVGCSAEDYRVYIGGEACTNLQLKPSALLCYPPQTKPPLTDSQNRTKILVKVGYRVFFYGYLQYHRTPWRPFDIPAILWSLVVAAILFLLFLVGLVFIIYLERRRRKYIVSGEPGPTQMDTIDKLNDT